eukprot:jgi/Ulvmu1/10373/UM061_0056.1
MTASGSAPGTADGHENTAVLRGEVQESHTMLEKPTEAAASESKPTAPTQPADVANANKAQSTNSCMNLKLKELNKRQKKKLKELNKMFAEKSKNPEKAAEAMRLAAEAAIHEQTKLAQSAIEMDMAKREATEALAYKDLKLTQSRELAEKLKDICRELQHQSHQCASENEKIRIEEAQKRKESAEEVSAVLENLSERLNKQSEDVVATSKENDDLRAKLTQMSQVLTLSDEIRTKYETECTRMRDEAQAQKEVAEAASARLQESEKTVKTYADRVTELQDATMKASEAIKSCHATNKQLSADKKDMAALNNTMREEYAKVASLLTRALEDNKAKELQIQKLQLAVQRLESLCRCLQGRVRASTEDGRGEAAAQERAATAPECDQTEKQLARPVRVVITCAGDTVKLSLTVL